MRRCEIKYVYALSFLIVLLNVLSCGFIDLRPIEIQIFPDKTDSLLPDQYSPVILKFNTAMDEYRCEGLLQITNSAGVVNGDRYWNGNDLRFVPQAGWTAGTRYTISLSGIAMAVDGRELRLERFVTFYAINKSAPPLLEWYSPDNGESVRTGSLSPEFHFSRPMDKLSVENALVIEGISGKIFEWRDDYTALTVRPEKELSPWLEYRWTLKETAKSRDGVPIPKSYSGVFCTDLDQSFPVVSKVYPVLYSAGHWIPTGLDIETGLGHGQGIAIEFSKTMGENWLRSVRVEPSITGRTEQLSEKTLVYIISRDLDPQTNYTLIISGDTRDNEGLKIGEDYRINFAPYIPYLDIISLTFNNSQQPITAKDLGGIIAVPVEKAAGELSFTINFSLPIDPKEKQANALKISLVPFFPRTLPPVALNFAHWIYGNQLIMRWEGFEPSNESETHYYKLVIPGGKGGLTDGAGGYFKEDQTFFLEAVPEAINEH